MAEPYTVQALQIEISDNSTNVGRGVETMIRSLQKLQTATSSSALRGLTALSDAIKTLVDGSKGLEQVAKAMATLANAINRLGKVSINKDLADQLDKVIKVAGSITQEQVERVVALADAMERLSKAAVRMKAIQKLVNPGNTGTTTSPTTGGAAGATTASGAADSATVVPPGTATATSSMQAASAAAGGAASAMTSAGSAASSAATSMGAASSSASSAAGAMKRFGTASATAAGAVEKSSSRIRIALKIALGTVTTSLKGLSIALRGIGTVTRKALGPVATLVRSFGRIAFYRLIRSAIKAITDGFSEGVKHIESYSRAVGTDLAPNMDKCRAATSYLTNSLGALAAPIINAVTPALVTLIDHFVTLTNLIGKFFAALSGATMFTQAKKDVDAYDKSLASAGGSAKKLKDYTMGIDELNVIKEPNSGGGSGSKADEDYSNMFEEVAIDSPIIALAERIKSLVTSGDWEGIGQFLGRKFNDLVSWVDGKHLGSKLAEKLNNAVSLFRGLVHTTDWAAAGQTVANLVNDFFDGVDIVGMGQTVIDAVAGALEFLYTWIGQTNWGNIGKRLAELLSSIDIGAVLSGLVKLVSNLLKGILDFAIGFLKNFDIGNIAKAVGQFIRSIFVDVDWLGLVGGVFEFALDALASLLTAPFDIIGGLFEGLFSDPLEDDLNKAIDITGTKAQELHDYFDQIFADYDDKLHGINVNAQLADKYISRLVELDDLPSLSPDQMAEYKDLVAKLTDMFPDLTAVIDESTGRLEDGAAALRDQVDSAITLARIEAGKEKLEEIQRTALEAERERANIAEKIEQVTTDSYKQQVEASRALGRKQTNAAVNVGKARAALANGLESGNMSGDDAVKYAEQITYGLQNIKDMGREGVMDYIGAAQESLDLLNAQWDSLTTTINDCDRESKNLINTIYGVDDAVDGVGNSGEGMKQRMTNALNTIVQAFDDGRAHFASNKWRIDFESKWHVTTNMELDVGNISVKSHGAQTVANALRQQSGFFGDFSDIRSINGVYATGGLVESGEIFMARENGLTEYVGSFGGKTGVANNDQIIAGIAQGVAMAVAPRAESYSSGSDRIVNAVYANRTDVRIGDSDIANANGRAVANGGTRMSQGVFAFAR